MNTGYEISFNQAIWDDVELKLRLKYPHLQWGKLCFAYCGDDRCNCGANLIEERHAMIMANYKELGCVR